MEEKKKRLWWQEFTRPEIVEHAKKNDIAILPIGSIEQHGEHLPCGEDTYHAIGICERVAEKTGVMLLPTPWYGAHPYQHWYYAGTIPLRDETFVNMCIDIIKGAAVAGYNKFIIFNSHGQEWAVPSVVQQLGLEGYFVAAPTLWDIAKREIIDVVDTGIFGHADESETSLGLYLVPHLVHMERAYDEYKPEKGLIDSKWFTLPPFHTKPNTMPWWVATCAPPEHKHLEHGVIGYATKGTAEKGEKIVNAAVDWLVEFIEELKKRWPPGVKPPVK